MIKELFLAIALGAILGFGITGGILTLNQNKKNISQNTIKNEINLTPTPAISQSPTPTITDQTQDSLSIDSPENESIVSDSKISIKGSASPNNIIIVQTPSKVYNSNADDSGSFSIDIDLETGVNSIKITAIDLQSNQTSESNLLVTFSTAKI